TCSGGEQGHTSAPLAQWYLCHSSGNRSLPEAQDSLHSSAEPVGSTLHASFARSQDRYNCERLLSPLSLAPKLLMLRHVPYSARSVALILTRVRDPPYVAGELARSFVSYPWS